MKWQDYRCAETGWPTTLAAVAEYSLVLHIHLFFFTKFYPVLLRGIKLLKICFTLMNKSSRYPL